MSKDNSITKCECGEQLEPEFDICPNCGKPVQLLCPQCQKPVKPKWKFCPKCRLPLSGSETPPVNEIFSTPKGDSRNNRVFVSMKGKGQSSKTPLYLPAGEILVDRYRIVQKLDEGGFGEVYEVEDIGFGQKRQRALKVVVVGKGAAKQAVEQIVHEFDLRSRITEVGHIINSESPQTCEYKELSLVLLPMDFADGGNLHQWLLRNQQEENRQKKGIEFFRQACLGVHAIHNAGLVHLDIKPENILLVEGKAKISDFGIGRYYSDLFEKNPEQLLHGELGTPEYMSPEQFEVARERDIGPTSDIYSLGIVLFEILDGNKPFDGARTEIRKQHLEMWPLRLRGDLKPLWQIVKRCMEKDAINRYPNIGQLLNDLDRIAEGLALSIEVSCPICGRVNSDKDKIDPKCKSCGNDLPKDFFIKCPVCGRRLRRDEKSCKDCGKNVAAYNQQKARKAQVEDLKGKDPVVTITLLEELLQFMRETGDEISYHEKAIKLLKELREKKEQIVPLVKKARKAEEEHFPKQAIETWEDVHKIVPLHQEATERIQALESLIKEFREGWKKAVSLMEQAKFQEARNLLQKCHKDIPTREDISGLLTTCRERASKYNFAFDDASTAVRDKLIQEAEKQLDKALSHAPSSEEALTLKKKIQKILQETKPLIQQIRNQFACAEFTETDKTIAKIEEQQIDDSEVLSLKKELAKTWKDYTRLIENAQSAMKSHDLIKATELINKATELCPNSTAVRDLLEQVKNGQQNARELVDEASLAINAAKFEEAEALLKQAGERWSTVDSLEDSREKLRKTQSKYNRHITQARESKTGKDLEKAQEEADLALMVCPNSEEAKCLLRDVIKEKANNLMETAKFEEAEVLLKQAKKLWPTVDGFNEVEDTLTKTCTWYKRCMRRARWAKVWKRFAKALIAVEQVEKICPRSRDVVNLKNDIGIATPKWEEKKKRARNRATKIAKRIIFLIPAIIGVILFLYSQFELGGIAVLISALAIFFKKDCHKKIYGAIRFCWSSVAKWLIVTPLHTIVIRIPRFVGLKLFLCVRFLRVGVWRGIAVIVIVIRRRIWFACMLVGLLILSALTGFFVDVPSLVDKLSGLVKNKDVSDTKAINKIEPTRNKSSNQVRKLGTKSVPQKAAQPRQDRPKSVSNKTVKKRKVVATKTEKNGNYEKLSKAINFYAYGEAGHLDYVKAKKLFLELAEQNDPLGKMWVARCYHKGRCLFPYDPQKAERMALDVIKQIKVLANNGNVNAVFLLGSAYNDGLGVNQDYRKAFDWSCKGANAGSGLAMCNLAMMYGNGHGVAKDYRKAVEWYRKAGDSQAIKNLGVMYEEGKGVIRNYQKAIEWYRKAAEIGNGEAMTRLGVMYERERGVTKNYKKAISWYYKGAEAGDSWAMVGVASVYEEGKGVLKNYETAVDWYRKAAEAGNSHAMYKLGWMYNNGKGVSRDYRKAIEWYRKAAKLGDEYAQKKLTEFGEKW